MSTTIQLLHGDAIELMRTLPDGSVDFILADPSFGSTANAWDKVPDLAAMWRELKRVCVGVAAIYGIQPFTTDLINSNRMDFRYEWIWDRVNKRTNFLCSKRMPLRQHEGIYIFDLGAYRYIPQMELRDKPFVGRRTQPRKSSCYNSHGGTDRGKISTHRFPTSVLPIKGANTRPGLHPNEKPVALSRYLIRTFSEPGQTVLDCFMGRGGVGEACRLEGRSFIGIERDDHWFAESTKRLEGVEA